MGELTTGPWVGRVRLVVAGPDLPGPPILPANVRRVGDVRETLALVGPAPGEQPDVPAPTADGVTSAGPLGDATLPGLLLLTTVPKGSAGQEVQHLAARPDDRWAVVTLGSLPTARWRLTVRADGTVDTGPLAHRGHRRRGPGAHPPADRAAPEQTAAAVRLTIR